MDMRWKRVAMAGATALAACLSTAAAQEVELGTFDGWRLFEIPGDACVMVTPANHETAQSRVYLRFEPGRTTELVAGTILPMEVPDPDAVDWGRLTPAEAVYAFGTGAESGTVPGSQAEVHVGYEYLDPHRVRLDLYFDADEAMLDALARSQVFAVSIDGDNGFFGVAHAGRALAEARRCSARQE